ncbi:hypothetical protein A33K_12823 [Burkholderia humptydooensis MSMB43]|uniref:Uncharacterized protein n=1 Tax=Burkholderia humptydooensis MSMB43 TaxID=441157 RepID=A0ABN0GAY6_9BURK|nr:hypothetical protein A33K_12823 [Burkholderia humptydooensis MSMB43]
MAGERFRPRSPPAARRPPEAGAGKGVASHQTKTLAHFA